jgi:hypothetical protein
MQVAIDSVKTQYKVVYSDVKEWNAELFATCMESGYCKKFDIVAVRPSDEAGPLNN